MTEIPNTTAESLERAVSVTVWVAVGSLALVILLLAVFAVLMVKRQNWARIALMVVGVMSVPASVIAVDALSDDAAVTNRTYVLIGIGLQALLILIAAVLMYRPVANIWFSTKPPRQGGESSS